MFDNLNPQSQNSPLPQTQMPPVETPPSTSLPPFSPQDLRPRPLQPQQTGGAAAVGKSVVDTLPEDIFAATEIAPSGDTSLKQVPQLKPLGSASPYTEETAPSVASLPPSVMDMPQEEGMPREAELTSHGGGKRKFLVFLLSAVIVALIFIAGYLVYRIISAQQGFNFLPTGIFDKGLSDTTTLAPTDTEGVPPETTETPTPPVEEEKGNSVIPQEPVPTGETEDGGEQMIPPTPPVVEPVADADGDGLTDEKENSLGTNQYLLDSDSDGLDDYSEVRVHTTDPMKADTDSDGLNDQQEIQTYYSDPKVADTDGDGYDDFTEVQNGYSPVGSGRIM